MKIKENKYGCNLIKMKKLIGILFMIGSINLIGQNHYIVTKNTDSYPAQQGELRWAITEANLHLGLDYIDFNIPTIVSSVPVKITLAGDYPGGSGTLRRELPECKDPVIIDGNTQPPNGYNGNEPKINICGGYSTMTINILSSGAVSSSPILSHLFSIGGTSSVKNITFSEYLYVGMFVRGENNLIENCVFNTGYGAAIRCTAMSNSTFKGNYFGTDKSLSTLPSLKIMAGILMYNALEFNGTQYIDVPSKNNIIGGPTASDKNYFYNCTNYPSSFPFPAIQINGVKPNDPQYLKNINNKIQNNIFIGNYKNIDLGNMWNGCSGNLCKSKPIITKAEINGNNITVEGTSGANDYVEIYKTNIGNIDAEYLIGTDNADASGNWSFTVPKGIVTAGHLVIGTATDGNGNTSEFGSTSFPVSTNPCMACPSQSFFTYAPQPVLINQSITFTSTNICTGNVTYSWDFGDPTSSTNASTLQNPKHTFAKTGMYIVKLTTTLNGCVSTKAQLIRVAEQIACENCIGSFAPQPGAYVLSAWVKQEIATTDTLFYHLPQLKVYFPTTPTNFGNAVYTCTPSGDIIDGWQRIETEIIVPPSALYINLQLKSIVGNCYFDDIRIFPKDASMTSYVYDPTNLRLVAELDERNYATLYEYDEEGKLIRVKKETEKGVMTIKENKNSTKKQ